MYILVLKGTIDLGHGTGGLERHQHADRSERSFGSLVTGIYILPHGSAGFCIVVPVSSVKRTQFLILFYKKKIHRASKTLCIKWPLTLNSSTKLIL